MLLGNCVILRYRDA